MESLANITTAHREYARRPQDERYASLADLLTAASHDKSLSAERTYNAKDLRVVATDNDLMLGSAKGVASMSHWAFGQLARTLESPAGFLRDSLTPQLAADVLNYRISQTPNGEALSLLARGANGAPPKIRAITSDQYARIWDADLYGTLQGSLVGRSSGTGDAFHLPTAWDGKPAGAYRGDRDSFVTLIDGGSIVNDPSARTDGRMFRGIMVRNSEVGASSVTIETVTFRFICGNLMLWGASYGSRFRRRHVGTRVLRDSVREIVKIAAQWTSQSAQRDEALIKALIDREIASTKEGVIDELRAIGFSEADANAAYGTCEREENASPRSFWGAVQGATRVSQMTPYQDERYELDKLAGLILARGAKLVAA